jgi:hypothetical protein
VYARRLWGSRWAWVDVVSSIIGRRTVGARTATPSTLTSVSAAAAAGTGAERGQRKACALLMVLMDPFLCNAIADFL